ncbi:hypothetical protein INR49_001292 [Caranx melampygus]|nr:hypothetical protein INR49_001292 [Caranx melampygus]
MCAVKKGQVSDSRLAILMKTAEETLDKRGPVTVDRSGGGGGDASRTEASAYALIEKCKDDGGGRGWGGLEREGERKAGDELQVGFEARQLPSGSNLQRSSSCKTNKPQCRTLDSVPVLLYILALKTLLQALCQLGGKIYQNKRTDAAGRALGLFTVAWNQA